MAASRNALTGAHFLAQVNETVFLGVVLDNNLTWKPHISSLAGKISKSIGIIFRSSFYLSTPLCMLYNAMILPYLNYCNLVWGSTYKTNLQRIIILQKPVIRMVNKSYYNAHTEPIFKKLNLLKFPDIHLTHLGQFMFSFKKAILPRKFENTFTINTKSIATTQGMQTPFVYHYVEQISDNSPYSFKVLNFLILFHLKFRALHR